MASDDTLRYVIRYTAQGLVGEGFPPPGLHAVEGDLAELGDAPVGKPVPKVLATVRCERDVQIGQIDSLDLLRSSALLHRYSFLPVCLFDILCTHNKYSPVDCQLQSRQ